MILPCTETYRSTTGFFRVYRRGPSMSVAAVNQSPATHPPFRPLGLRVDNDAINHLALLVVNDDSLSVSRSMVFASPSAIQNVP